MAALARLGLHESLGTCDCVFVRVWIACWGWRAGREYQQVCAHARVFGHACDASSLSCCMLVQLTADGARSCRGEWGGVGRIGVGAPILCAAVAARVLVCRCLVGGRFAAVLAGDLHCFLHVYHLHL